MNLESLKQTISGTPLATLAEFLSEEYLASIKHGDFPKWRRLLEALPDISPSTIELRDSVSIGKESDCDAASIESLRLQLEAFIPWRKGPFSLFDIDIDTEWCSDLKWDRLEGSISSLEDRKVLDVGAGNGYYSYRMLGAGAELVIGIDPHIAYVAQFWATKHFLPKQNVYVLPLGLEDLPSQLKYFDTVFSMGVLYHRRSPIDHLMLLRNCLRPGGELILETLYVEGDAGYSLVPESKYARMSNVWFVPSIGTIELWLSRCGFTDIQVIDTSITTTQEQRKTKWMPYDSLEDALDNSNPQLTIEGLPSPRRVVIRATV